MELDELKTQDDYMAIQWDGENIDEIIAFMAPVEPVYMSGFTNSDEIVGVPSVEGLIGIGIGGWIEKRLDGLRTYPTHAMWEQRFSELMGIGEGGKG